MPRIKVIPFEEATGRLKEIYMDLIQKRGKLAGVHTIQSLRPESIVSHMDLYLDIMFSKSELSRAEREMMAVVVSNCNRCHYCQVHHGNALNHYWKDEERLSLLILDFRQARLSNRELQLCIYAESLTQDPGLSEETDLTKALRDVGLNDPGILDATLVIAYFNFVNRLVSGLDVSLEPDQGSGYKY